MISTKKLENGNTRIFEWFDMTPEETMKLSNDLRKKQEPPREELERLVKLDPYC